MKVGQMTSRLEEVVGKIIKFLLSYFVTHLRNNLLQSQRPFVVVWGTEDTSIKDDNNEPRDINQSYIKLSRNQDTSRDYAKELVYL